MGLLAGGPFADSQIGSFLLMSRRFLFAAVAATSLVVLATPALAGSSKPARTESIDDLKASDAELLQAISGLDGEVASQQQKVSTAQQALDVAEQAVAAVGRQLGETQSRLDSLKGVASDRAIEQYMRPQDEASKALTNGGELGDITRRAAILQQVNANDYSTLDQLRAVKIDLKRDQKSALEARNVANDRRAQEQKELDRLNAARFEKARLDASLQERIKVYASEDEASARVASANNGRASRGGGDASGDGRVSAAGLQWPVSDHRINSPFGYRWGRLHAGVDIEAKIGTPIRAAKGGKVTSAGWESGYGNYTCIDAGGGFSTCYGHQSQIGVSAGDSVQTGQQIGLSGNTGASQGAHLHFETRISGAPQDPMQYLP